MQYIINGDLLYNSIGNSTQYLVIIYMEKVKKNLYIYIYVYIHTHIHICITKSLCTPSTNTTLL